MPRWQDINRDSWTFARDIIIGDGGGAGDFLTSYALFLEGGQMLNGSVSAGIAVDQDQLSGAGLICRANDEWSFVAFYMASGQAVSTMVDGVEKTQIQTVARLSVFRQGVFEIVATASAPVVLDEKENRFVLEFFSGQMRGSITTARNTYELRASCPHIPFPGHVGLVKFYGSTVTVRDFRVHKSDAPFSMTVTRRGAGMPYDVFICYSSADKIVVQEVVRELRLAGITCWFDLDEISFGKSVTHGIEEGLRKSRFVIPCVSTNLAKSGWTRAEYGSVLNSELSGDSRRMVVPLLLDNCLPDDIPLLLRDKKRVALSSRTEFNEFIKFLKL